MRVLGLVRERGNGKSCVQPRVCSRYGCINDAVKLMAVLLKRTRILKKSTTIEITAAEESWKHRFRAYGNSRGEGRGGVKQRGFSFLNREKGGNG